MRQIIVAIAVLAASVCGSPPAMGEQARGEILWDSYGVPHIYGEDAPTVFHGFGWAQARSHSDILLRLYGEARGKGAEYWGEEYLETARWVVANDVPARAVDWHAAQSPDFRRNLDAFAAGINAFAEAHPESIDPELAFVLPVSGVDVVAHAHRLMNFVYVASPARTIGGQAPPLPGGERDGSNAWAVAPSRSASGSTLLLANPHLPWGAGFFTYYEAHMTGPDFEMYGATQVGLPVIRFAFNTERGIVNTVNGVAGSTSYLIVPEGEDGYRFDGEVLPFEIREEVIGVRQPDGSVTEETLVVRSTVHGPVFERQDGALVALRVAGLDRPGALEQYFDMMRAGSFEEFQQVMNRLQVPTFNIIYGDRDGNIAYVHNGIVPERSSGDLDFWTGLVPGDTSEFLWDDVHPFEDLPQVSNPETGFVQNANDPPWAPTWPPVYTAEDFPAYMARSTPLSLRAQNSLNMIADREQVDFDTFVELKLSTRAIMADRVLDDLVAAGRAAQDPALDDALELLAGWDRNFDSDSRAALLFEEWARLFAGNSFSDQENYAVRWSMEEGVSTPRGIADTVAALDMLKEAVDLTVSKYGALDRPFGDVSRFRVADADAAGHGGYGNLGIFRVMTWSELDEDGTRRPLHGETWVSMVEFSDPVRAIGLMSYGNSRQPGKSHHTDQLEMLAANEFRTLWLSREEIERHTVERTVLDPSNDSGEAGR
jgi:acyl-homoserine lactone acylase PvdQ